MFSVIGENESVNLDFIEEAFGEERTDRTVGHAHRQNFFVGGTAFAFDESSGEASCRGEFFTVVDLKREEVRAFPGGTGADGREDAGVAHAYDAGTVSEVSEFAGGDFHCLSGGELHRNFCFHCGYSLSVVCGEIYRLPRLQL